MKKKALSKKLRLNKSIVSSLQASQIKGGGTSECIAMDDSRNCVPNLSIVDCGGNFTEHKTQFTEHKTQ